MKTIEIIVERGAIDRELSKLTSYTGAKHPGDDSGTVYERVALSDEDSTVLDRYWNAAVSELVDRLRNFVTDVESAPKALRIRLEVSGAYDDSLTPSVKENLFTFMLMSVGARWMRLSFPEKAGEWEREAAGVISEAERKLYHRRRPKRAGVAPEF